MVVCYFLPWNDVQYTGVPNSCNTYIGLKLYVMLNRVFLPLIYASVELESVVYI